MEVSSWILLLFWYSPDGSYAGCGYSTLLHQTATLQDWVESICIVFSLDWIQLYLCNGISIIQCDIKIGSVLRLTASVLPNYYNYYIITHWDLSNRKKKIASTWTELGGKLFYLEILYEPIPCPCHVTGKWSSRRSAACDRPFFMPPFPFQVLDVLKTYGKS